MVMIISDEFNRGFWCAIQEFSAQGVSDSQILSVLQSAGLSQDECIELMGECDYRGERLQAIVDMLND